MKRTLALLALLLAITASPAVAAPGAPPDKRSPHYYCLGFVKPPQCFRLPPAVGKPSDRLFGVQRREAK